ncbi:MAG: hypothetical protein EOO61_15380 [Hymenobacter sp.]|nr:MAG: hypothetical protein EOO61_15380 [Hymenobacter sp.]
MIEQFRAKLAKLSDDDIAAEQLKIERNLNMAANMGSTGVETLRMFLSVCEDERHRRLSQKMWDTYLDKTPNKVVIGNEPIHTDKSGDKKPKKRVTGPVVVKTKKPVMSPSSPNSNEDN